MVHIFHFLQTGIVFENLNPFSWTFNAISSEKSCLISKPFLTCLLDVRTLDFSRLLNPDWSIQISRATAVCKGAPPSTHFLEYGRHVGQLRRRRRRAYAPTSNTASQHNHEKINSCVSFSFLYEYGAPLGGPSGRRSSAISCISYSEIQG